MSTINPGSIRTVVGLASATSANGTARNGAALPLALAQPGSVSARVAGSITTSSVIATYKWQVTDDTGGTWYDMKLPNNAANVATSAGTGSVVAHSLCLELPFCAMGWKYARLVATLSGAATDPADVTAVDYRYNTCDDYLT